MSGLVLSGMDVGCAGIRNCHSALWKLGMALGLTGAVASPRQRRCKFRPWPNLFGNGRNAARFRCNQTARFRCNQSSSKVGFAEAPPSRPCPSKGNGLTWHSTQSGLWLCARLALSLLLCSEDWLRRSPCASAMLKRGKRLGMALGLTGAVASPRQSSSKLGSALGLRYRCCFAAKIGFASAKLKQAWLCARLALSLHRFWGKCNRECQQYWKHLKPVTGLR